MHYLQHKRFFSIAYLVFFCTTFGFFFINYRLLSQANPVLFNQNHDATELVLLMTGLPKYLTNHPKLFWLADLLLFLLPVIFLISYKNNQRSYRLSGVLASFYLGMYLLLQNIFNQIALQSYLGLFLLSFLFSFHSADRFYKTLSFCRYVFLYIMVSSAIWKICRGAVFNQTELSNILLYQHADVLNDCKVRFCQLYFYLIEHSTVSYILYITATLIELFFLAGFFTRKYDKILLVLFLVFLIFDQIIMRISFWPMLIFGISLLMHKPDNSKQMNTTFA